jgi:hypothetical protein
VIALDAVSILGSSVLAFILGVLIGVSLGYLIWAAKDEQ